MNVKLTLTLEESVITSGKEYARKQNRSLSDLVENLLKALISENKKVQEIEIPFIVQQMKGKYKEPKDIDWKKDKTERLAKKYFND